MAAFGLALHVPLCHPELWGHRKGHFARTLLGLGSFDASFEMLNRTGRGRTEVKEARCQFSLVFFLIFLT